MSGMRNHASMERRFDRFGRREWWPYVAELLVNERHRRMTVRLLQAAEAVYALSVDRRWTEVVFGLCEWMERRDEAGELPGVQGVEDAVVRLHNFVAPGTPTGEALRALLNNEKRL